MTADTPPAPTASDSRLLRSVIERGIQNDPSTARAAADPGRVSNARRFLEGTMGVPFTEGNRIEVLKNGDEIFPSMLEAIGAARRTIDFLTFVYWSGDIGTRFANLLAEKAAAGLRVRVLLDGWGSRPIDRHLIDEMKAAGADVRWFRPLQKLELSKMNHRTHRKLVVVDEEIGFTGGVGIADEWQGDARDESEWRDTHFRVTGPAVSGLKAAFLDNWIETDVDFLQPGVDQFPPQPQEGDVTLQVIRGASESSWSDVSTLFLTLLQLARERLWITTAYFVPDGELLRQLCEAAKLQVASHKAFNARLSTWSDS
jgi:cardiolipin synthase